jgi:hypothetical protein
MSHLVTIGPWRLNLRITVGSFEAIREELGIDLYQLVDGELAGLTALLRDPVKLAGICWVLIRAQKNAPDRREFFESLTGDDLVRLADGFLEALADFFPHAQTRELLRLVLRKARAATELLLTEVDRAIEQVERIDPAQIARVATASKRPSGGSAARSDSIPAP